MNRKEYNTCVDCHADGLYRFMLKGIGNDEKAKDLVQDAFERLWLKHTEVDGEKAKAYLFTIAYHAMIDLIRKEKHLCGIDDINSNTLYHTQQYSDLNEVLHKAIEQLPHTQRLVVLLRDYEGYSYAEIGEITGLGESQVKVYIYRARMFLREYIGSMEKVI